LGRVGRERRVRKKKEFTAEVAEVRRGNGEEGKERGVKEKSGSLTRGGLGMIGGLERAERRWRSREEREESSGQRATRGRRRVKNFRSGGDEEKGKPRSTARNGGATLAGLKPGAYIRRMGWVLVVCLAVCGCGRGTRREAGEVVFVIEANPANLDPRFATDGQSQRIDRLIFDGLVERDARMELHGDLAESWETPDALTYVFHLRRGVRFHDGRELSSRDVKATIAYMMDAGNKSPKRGAFNMIAGMETPDAWTVIFHLREAYASFLWNLEKSAVGIVPAGAGSDFGRNPVGTGPFRFVSQAQDDFVVIERNGDYFRGEEREKLHTEDAEIRTRRAQRRGETLVSEEGESGSLASLGMTGNLQQSQGARRRDNLGVSQDAAVEILRPQKARAQDDSTALTTGGGDGAHGEAVDSGVKRVTFRVVPDAIVRALELRKGSADVEMSSLSPDMIPVLEKRGELEVEERAGTNFAYLGTNLEDPILAKREVRQALAYATDRESLVKYLLRGEARLASGILPPNHWAYEGDVKKYGYDPAEAETLLEAAGFRRGADGMRMHLTLKVSTQEQARLLGAALQDQWKKVGVGLEVRPLETATLFSDLTKGNFQLSYSIWVGANNDPDVFSLVFSSERIPPNGSNRGHYRNARVDELIAGIRAEMDREKRKALCSEVQKIVAEDVPYVPLWYVDVVSVHRRGMAVGLTPTGDYDFLVGEEKKKEQK
jgi:ABC-type transport system substrate-binding protein